MIFVDNLKRFLSLIAFFGLTSQAIAAPSYDFFKDSTERIDEAAAFLKKSPTDAASIVLFLENLRDSYYTHLDRIESALPYWQWAIHHPYRYTASQFPHKWFTYEKNQAEIEKIHAMINAVREVYSKEFGIIVRLLAMRQEDALDDAAWLAEVKKGVATILMTPLEDLSSTELIIQKLSDHEQDVVKMVAKVQSPNWLKRHWRSLFTTAVATAVAAYYYMNNKKSVDTFCMNGVENAKYNFVEYCYKPVESFVNVLRYGQEEKYTINKLDKQGSIENKETDTRAYWEQESQKYIDEAYEKIDEGIKGLGNLAEKSQQSSAVPNDLIQKDGLKIETALLNLKIEPKAVTDMQNRVQTVLEDIAEPKVKNFSKALQSLGEAFKKIIKGFSIKGQIIEHDEKRVMNDTAFNRKLFGLIPAFLLVTKTYDGIKGLFNWFTKRDRSTLINRLRQVQQVLIRTTHTTELSDTEYGRLLYLLTKTHDQVIKNVPSNERIAFLNDLTYIANAQSSIKQKRKTLKTMWNSYRSLQQVT